MNTSSKSETTTKQILVAYEKHGDRYFDVSTPDKLASVSKFLLQERKDMGYYDIYSYVNKEDEELAKLTEEQLSALPDNIRADFNKRIQRVSAAKKEKERQEKWLVSLNNVLDSEENIFKTLSKGTKWEREEPVAWMLLKSRNAGEYERVSIESLSIVE